MILKIIIIWHRNGKDKVGLFYFVLQRSFKYWDEQILFCIELKMPSDVRVKLGHYWVTKELKLHSLPSTFPHPLGHPTRCTVPAKNCRNRTMKRSGTPTAWRDFLCSPHLLRWHTWRHCHPLLEGIMFIIGYRPIDPC